MGKTEIYLWGTLLALVRDQLAAIDKQVAGDLGFWGRARFSSRTREIQKFIVKLLEKKAEVHGNSALGLLIADLDTISGAKDMWGEITKEEIIYVRRILDSLIEQ